MQSPIKILHLEDLKSDAELIRHVLKKGGIEFETLIVDNKAAYMKALTDYAPDIIFSDHNLPSFNSHEALTLFSKTKLNIPFLLITASISEDFAVDILKKGANDYLVKDRLERLPSAVINALEKFRLNREYKKKLDLINKNEKHFRALIENSSDAITLVNEAGFFIYQSPAVLRLSEYTKKEVPSRVLFDYIHMDDLPHLREVFNQAKELPNIPFPYLARLRKKSGQYIFTEGTIVNLLQDESVKAFILNFRDCSERIEAELERSKMVNDLLQRNKDLEQFSYIVSHNLRAPVANIIGLAEELQEASTFEELKKITNYLVQSTKKMDHVIIDLNHVLQAKHNYGKKMESVKFSEVVDDIRRSIPQLVSAEGVTFNIDFTAIDEYFTIKSYLHSIFFNLITNSIKYRQVHLYPIIQIRSAVLPDRLMIAYQDNGLGIDLEKNGKNLFGLYKRFHHHVEGKGMGLFMVKTQLDAIGGTISVNSTCDEGTVFTITFERK